MTFSTSESEVLRLLGEHAGVGLWDCSIVDGDPFRLESRWHWSPEFRRMLGYTDPTQFPDELKSLLESFHPDDLDGVLTAFNGAVADTAPVARWDIKFRLRLADGTYRWFRSIGSVTHDANGIASRACGSTSDIHDGEMATAELARHAQRALSHLSDAHAASQERFRQIADTSPDGIACTDENGIVTFWNEAAARRHGYSAEAMIGQPLDLLRPPEDRDGLSFLERNLARTGNVSEVETVRADGSRLVIDLSVSSWTESGRTCFGFISRDTTERKAREALLADLARRDSLTGLPNRPALGERIEARFASGEPFSVLMIDLDGFKEVNDSLGHGAGDKVLTMAGGQMASCLAPGDMLARFGGDEFGIVLADGSADHAAAIAEAVIRAVSQVMEIDGAMLAVGASVGIASGPGDGTSATMLLASADAALYAAKAAGRARFHRFTLDLRQAASDLHDTRRLLRTAVEENQFELYYQPQYRLSDRRLVGAEALLRWRHPEEGIVSPLRFLGVLERSPLAMRVGAFVMREACRQAAKWRRIAPHFTMGVNLFAGQLHDQDIPAKIEAILAENGLPAEALELELPETVQLDASEEVRQALADLKARGVGIALDDYGTGYASFTNLKDFPFTRLKIDRSFVQDMAGSAVDAAVVEAVLLMGRRLGVSVIAEGVETPEQEALLLSQGCSFGQGYLFGRPLPAAAFTDRLRREEAVSALTDRNPRPSLGSSAARTAGRQDGWAGLAMSGSAKGW